jgi:hypothetical protein
MHSVLFTLWREMPGSRWGRLVAEILETSLLEVFLMHRTLPEFSRQAGK